MSVHDDAAMSPLPAIPGVTLANRVKSDTAASETANNVLSIICVNWNSLRYLIDCIASIYHNPPAISFEIVVVDNASPEGGIDLLTERFPLVRVVKSEANLGFAGASNLGFQHSAGNYVLLLNPDTRIIGRAIEEMLRELRSQPDAGIVGCTLLNPDLSVSTTSIQKFPTILNQLLNVEWLRLRFPSFPLWNIAPLFSDHSSATAVEVIPGACMMLKRDVFQLAGLLSEDYFMYAEDIDLNYKISRLGFSRYYVKNAQIVHYGGGSSARQPVSQWSTVMTYRAMARYFAKTHGSAYAFVYRISTGFAALIRLTFLGVALPFGDRQAIRCAATKWRTILAWAIGISAF